jgi:hypothetical protein
MQNKNFSYVCVSRTEKKVTAGEGGLRYVFARAVFGLREKRGRRSRTGGMYTLPAWGIAAQNLQ